MPYVSRCLLGAGWKVLPGLGPRRRAPAASPVFGCSYTCGVGGAGAVVQQAVCAGLCRCCVGAVAGNCAGWQLSRARGLYSWPNEHASPPENANDHVNDIPSSR